MKEQTKKWLQEEFMCGHCDEIVKREGDLCPECRHQEDEAEKDRRFDEVMALGYGV